MPISHSGSPPRIGITVGDPRGIGPEVVKKALRSPAVRGKANLLLVGRPAVSGAVGDRALQKDKKASARAAMEYIDTAFKLITTKKIDALVTGPVSKEAMNRAGIKFEGHTEYLAGLCGCKKFAMMFVSDEMKIALVTRHIALNKVSRLLSIKAISDTIELTHKALRGWFGIKNPRIGVSGLNPHCSEGGLFGREERAVIIPAVRRAQESYRGIFGPIPADTLLYDVYHNKFDAAVCMYHDQGLAAFKMLARDKGVNLTVGLPFIRTSPDHGTAFDIAGKGIADPGSMIEAIRLAIKLSSTVIPAKAGIH